MQNDFLLYKIMTNERKRHEHVTVIPPHWLRFTMLLSVLTVLAIYNHSFDMDSPPDGEAGTALDKSHQLAAHESLGFFTDISDDDWKLRKQITHQTLHHAMKENYEKPMITPRAWYQNNWNEDFSCSRQVGMGGMADGHKFVCDPDRFQNDCLVYSFGSNKNFDFERAINELAPQCEIHIFDPDNYEADMLREGIRATYHAWGLTGSYESSGTKTARETLKELVNAKKITLDSAARHDTVVEVASEDAVEYKTFQEILVELGHVGRRIDVFKIDCEGCEWQTYKDWIMHSKVDIRQVCVEVHNFPPMANEFFQDMHDEGYVIFHKEANIEWANGDCVEFSFLKLHQDFFGQD
jgi:hypothetical protein